MPLSISLIVLFLFFILELRSMPFQDRNPTLDTVQGGGFLRGLLPGDEDEKIILKGCLGEEDRSYEAMFNSVLKQRAEDAGVEASSQLGRRH